MTVNELIARLEELRDRNGLGGSKVVTLDGCGEVAPLTNLTVYDREGAPVVDVGGDDGP